MLHRALDKTFEQKYVAHLSNRVEIENEKPASTKQLPGTGSNHGEYI